MMFGAEQVISGALGPRDRELDVTSEPRYFTMLYPGYLRAGYLNFANAGLG